MITNINEFKKYLNENITSLKFEDFNQFKNFNQKAYYDLINLWAELSHSSTKSAQRNLSKEFGDRYHIKNDNGQLSFYDQHTGYTYKYSPESSTWL